MAEISSLNNQIETLELPIEREAMCVMTSNIFGAIAADNLGYARVELQDTIARGAQECKIVIYLQPSEALDEFATQEYFKAE